MPAYTSIFSLVATNVNTFTNINMPAADQSLTVSPVTNPQTTLSSVNVIGNTVSGPEREFLVNIGLSSGTGSPPSNNNDKVSLFSGVNCNPGTSNCWSFYTAIAMTAGSGDYTAIGYEIDLNNFNVSLGNSGNLTSDLSGNVANGLQITGAATKTCSNAILIASEAPGGEPPQWARGLTLAGTMTLCAIQDATVAPVGIQLDGNYSTAAINLTSVYGNPGATSPTALFMRNNQGISWQNASATAVITDKTDTSNNRYVGIGSAGVFLGAPTAPISAGMNLGSNSNYWGEIFSPNGVVAPSDVSLKTRVSELPHMSEIIRKVQPIQFSWSEPERFDDKVHYGFDANTIKENFPADFAGHREYGGLGHLVKDELISVLWQANREMLERIDRLEEALNTVSS